MHFQNKIEKFKRYIGRPIKHVDDAQLQDGMNGSASPDSGTLLGRPGRRSLDALSLFRLHCHRRRRNSIRSVIGPSPVHGTSPDRSLLHPDPEDVARSPPPHLIAAFANSLTQVKLSNFLIWFFYFDVVELPNCPTKWFGYLPSMDLRGWMALGIFLKTHSAEEVMFLRLDELCQQLRIRVPQVLNCAIELADPKRMCWTRVATTIQIDRFQRKDEGQILDSVQKIYFDMRGLVSSLKPDPQTVFAEWQPIILSRLSDFLDVVLHPRLTLLREGMRILTERSQEEENEIHYFYEAMQLPRKVPLCHYGNFSDLSVDFSHSSSNASTEQMEPCQREHCASTDEVYAQHLKSENNTLRARVLALEKSIAHLRATNQDLARALPRTLPEHPIVNKCPCLTRKPVPGPSRSNRPLPPLPASSSANSVHGQVSARAATEPLHGDSHIGNQDNATSGVALVPSRRSVVMLEGQMEAREWMGSMWRNRELPSLPLTNPLTAHEQAPIVSEWGRREGHVTLREPAHTFSSGTPSLVPAPLFTLRNRLRRSGSGQNLGSTRRVGGMGRKRSLSANALEMVGMARPKISTNF